MSSGNGIYATHIGVQTSTSSAIGKPLEVVGDIVSRTNASSNGVASSFKADADLSGVSIWTNLNYDPTNPSVNWSRNMFISAVNGNVGIKTTTPDVTLDVSGTLRSSQIYEGETLLINKYAQINQINSSKWNTATGNHIYNNNSGNVGIGVSAPSTHKLIINGSDNYLRLQSGTVGRSVFQFESTSTSATIANFTIDNTGLNIIHDSFTKAFSLGTNNAKQLTILGNGNVGIGTTIPDPFKLRVMGNIECTSVTQTSDDRIKINEMYIQNATSTLMKLHPQLYTKTQSEPYIIESGLIAQEVYYDAPELRHIVYIPNDASGIEIKPEGYGTHYDTPQNDPDYSNWGSSPAGINYMGLIPYLIKSNQEQQTEIDELKQKVNTLEQLVQQLLLLQNNSHSEPEPTQQPEPEPTQQPEPESTQQSEPEPEPPSTYDDGIFFTINEI
jgi:hypothetical protein